MMRLKWRGIQTINDGIQYFEHLLWTLTTSMSQLDYLGFVSINHKKISTDNRQNQWLLIEMFWNYV